MAAISAVAGLERGQPGAFDFDQGAGLECVARIHQVERRHDGADPGAALHQAFQRQPRQGFANARQAAAIAARQRLFVQPLAGRQPADDDVHQKLAIKPRLQQRWATIHPAAARRGFSKGFFCG